MTCISFTVPELIQNNASNVMVRSIPYENAWSRIDRVDITDHNYYR